MKIVCNKETKRKDIIKLVRHIMIDGDIKKRDIAYTMRQTEQTVSNLLNPNYRPNNSITIDTLIGICDAMGCEVLIEIRPKDKGAQSQVEDIDPEI